MAGCVCVVGMGDMGEESRYGISNWGSGGFKDVGGVRRDGTGREGVAGAGGGG